MGRFDLLDQEVERLFRSSNDELLEEVFEHLVYLVFFEVLLDLLHVVELLEFIHFAE